MLKNQQEIKQIHEKLYEVIPEWHNISEEEILLERMTGITNQTYKISSKNQSHSPIIYRKFGSVSDNVFLDREAEKYIYQHISDEGLGPKIYGYANGVRIQSFIQSKILPAKMMLEKDHYEKLAFTLSKFHQLKPSFEEVPYKSLFKRAFVQGAESLIEKCQKKLTQNIFDEDEKPLVQILRSWVTMDEIQDIKQLTFELETKELIFSHNDLLANNILIENRTGKFIFIDFEYAGYNYPIFDIANYLNETQYNYDESKKPYFKVIPPHHDLKVLEQKFIEAYIIGKESHEYDYKMNLQKGLQKQAQLAQKQYLLRVLPLGRMLSNLIWGWWAIIMSKNQEIDFDYLQYSQKRYDDYMLVKKSFIKL